MDNPRNANGARRRRVKARIRAQQPPCHLCGLPIDFRLPHTDQLSFTVDEIVPVSRGGSPYDEANCRAAHRCCNMWRGDKPLTKAVRMMCAARMEELLSGETAGRCAMKRGRPCAMRRLEGCKGDW